MSNATSPPNPGGDNPNNGVPGFDGPDYDADPEFTERVEPLMRALDAECRAANVPYITAFITGKRTLPGGEVHAGQMIAFNCVEGRTPEALLEAIHALYPPAFGRNGNDTLRIVSRESRDMRTGEVHKHDAPDDPGDPDDPDDADGAFDGGSYFNMFDACGMAPPDDEVRRNNPVVDILASLREGAAAATGGSAFRSVAIRPTSGRMPEYRAVGHFVQGANVLMTMTMAALNESLKARKNKGQSK